jgi:hypothetical protein
MTMIACFATVSGVMFAQSCFRMMFDADVTGDE